MTAAPFWEAMGERAPVFVRYMDGALPTEIRRVIFRHARASGACGLPHVQWVRAPISARVFKPDGAVCDFEVGDFVATGDLCLQIDELHGDPAAEGPTCLTYSIFDLSARRFVEHEFTMKMGTTRRIICYPCGSMKYGDHLSSDAWSGLSRLLDPRRPKKRQA